jgi:hypothetical protein
VYIDNVGRLGIGTSIIENTLQVAGSGYISGNVIAMSNMYVNNDLVVAGNTFTRYDQIVDSDLRLKKDIQVIDDALTRVCSLTGYTFGYSNDVRENALNRRSAGLIAQDVLAVLPEAVGSNVTTGMYGVEYGSLLGLVIEAIKDLKREIDTIKSSRM